MWLRLGDVASPEMWFIPGDVAQAGICDLGREMWLRPEDVA
jgi:hypothetical protein